MPAPFQRTRDDELLARLTAIDSDLGARLAAAPDSGRRVSRIDFLLERGTLSQADYARALRAWRKAPGPGLTWGAFEVMGELGRGLGGTVYAAHFEGSACALKVLRPPPAGVEWDLAAERFTREVDLLRRLDHPAIVRLRDAGVRRAVRYHATEFVEGGSLACALRTMDPARALGLCARVAEALVYAHDAGVIHRDLKPQNILLDRKGRPRLVDFGLAKDLDAASVTRSDAFLGTALYAAPEQVAGAKHVDARADVYGLAGVLRFLLTGRPPHDAQNMGEWFESMRRSVEPLTELPGASGRALEGINGLLIRALAPTPADRQPTMAAFLAELEAARKRF